MAQDANSRQWDKERPASCTVSASLLGANMWKTWWGNACMLALTVSDIQNL